MQFNAIGATISGLISNAALRGMAGAFVLRAVTTLLGFVLITLAARTLGEHDFGTYSVLFSAAGLFSVIATLGQQISLTRAWSEYSAASRPDLLKGAIMFSLGACVTGGALVGLPFYLWFARSHDTLLTIGVTAYFVSLAVLLTTSHLARTAIGFALGDGVGSLLLVVPALLYLLGSFALGGSTEVYVIFLLMAAGAGVAIVCQLALSLRKTLNSFPDFMEVKPAFDIRKWRARSFTLWISNSLEAANQYADVVIIGFLMTPSIAGAYFVTTRIANAFSMASTALYMFSTQHISNLYYEGQRQKLDSLLDTVAAVTVAIIAAGLLVILVGGHWILGIFSAEYVPYTGALALLTLGTAAATAAGSSGSILMLTGHEGRYLRIIGSAMLLRTVGFFVLIPLFGITGAVAATTISFFVMALMLRWAATNVAGIDGSVLRLLGRWRRRRLPLPAE